MMWQDDDDRTIPHVAYRPPTRQQVARWIEQEWAEARPGVDWAAVRMGAVICTFCLAVWAGVIWLAWRQVTR